MIGTSSIDTTCTIWDRERGVEVPVVMFAGDVLVFDGDVVHAGAQYSVGSTRVHVYLDVPELTRDPNFTWPFFRK